jgi:hypothetical protein
MNEESSTTQTAPTAPDTATHSPDARRAYQVLDLIAANPEMHRQGYWFTQTEHGVAGCFAGLTCVLAGDHPRSYEPTRRPTYEFSDVIPAGGDPVSGEPEFVRTRALRLLGLDDDDYSARVGPRRAPRYTANDLFQTWSTPAYLAVVVVQLFGPRPDDVPPLPASVPDWDLPLHPPATPDDDADDDDDDDDPARETP